MAHKSHPTQNLGDLLWSMQLWKMNLARNAHLLQSFLRCRWTFGHSYNFWEKNKWKNTWNNRRPGKRHIYILSYSCSKPLFKLYIFNKSQTKTGLVHFSFAHVFQLVEWGVWITVFDIPNGSCAFNLGNDSSTGWKMATPCWQWYLFKSKILDGCKIKWETGNCKHILAYTIRIENWSLTFLNYIANRWELQKAVCLGSFVERTWTCTTHFCHSIVNLLGGNSLCSKIPEQAII